MLNAHTAIRTFRELQFDVRAFLYALYDIYPAEGHEDKGVVEIKWSDGSVDVVPTFEFVRGMCNATFLKVIVGGLAELIPEITTIPIQGGKYQKTTLNLDIKGAPLKANFPEIGDTDTDLTVDGGTIVKLVADTVELPYDAVISKVEATEELYSTNADATSAEIGQLYLENGSILTRGDSPYSYPFTLDLSKVVWNQALQLGTRFRGSYDLSCYTQTQYSGNAVGLFKVTGYFRYDTVGYAEYAGHFKRYHAGVIVEIPVFKSISYGGSARGGSYTNIEFETYPMPKVNYPNYSMTEEMPASEIPNIVMLYPFKETRTKDHWYGTCYMTLREPTEDEQDRIVTVRNPTSKTLKLCNAWSFSTADKKRKTTRGGSNWISSTVKAATDIAIGFSSPLVGAVIGGASTATQDDTVYGSVEDLNYIEIPPFSAIDFLFQWEIKGGLLYAYMLPMFMPLTGDGNG